MNDPAYTMRMIRGKPRGTFDSIMLAGAWNLLDQDGFEVLLECQRRDIKVHVAGIFASGILVGGSTYKYDVASPEIIRRRELWSDLADTFGAPLPAVAIAFALLPAIVEKVAVGVKSAEEVHATVHWLESASRLNPQLWVEAKQRGLLSVNIPVNK
jgi:D-threo-aldose 1-dehydrogenase|tara:strand:+ start:2397 stop:2864 length:468 start_codon:yes stop_codon:yes gene_type:complete|eukprot:31238-Pelagococcus_subviridis.AAC.3